MAYSKNLKILVVYYQAQKSDRNTIKEHVFAFQKYSAADVWHYNACAGLPRALMMISFDLIIFHYTFLARRWNGRGSLRRLMKRLAPLAKADSIKIAFPQDEYIHTTILCEFIKDFGIDAIFTCHRKEDWEKIYPKSIIGVTSIFQTYTGYVDSQAEQLTKSLWKPHPEREFDIGYRARMLPFWLGSQGTLKWKITDEFRKIGDRFKFKMNISNDPTAVFLGHDWYKFLANCRVVLGCEGGATLLDPVGDLRRQVDAFVESNPGATFAETEKACFPGMDGMIELKTLSPRHFEAALTKTCQVLIEGHYEGVFQPDVHYIPLKRDFSNLDEVAKKILDVAYCEEMAERTYADIVQKGGFSYADFVRDTLDKVERFRRAESASQGPALERVARSSLWLNDKFFVPVAGYRFILKTLGYRILLTIGLINTYRSLRRRYLAWED